MRLALVLVLVACGPGDAEIKGGLYASTLEECNRTAATLCASITCENQARAAARRPARALPASCGDAGAR